MEIASKLDDTHVEKNKEAISEKILTISYETSTQILTEILNDLHTTSVPPELGSGNESSEQLKKVLQRAKFAKDTADIMRMYEICGHESDASVDKILGDMPDTPKSYRH